MRGARLLRIALSALALSLAACPEGHKVFDKVDAVATVDGKPLTTEAFSKEIAWARRTSAGVLPSGGEQLDAFKHATLEDVIDQTLVRDAAKAAGVAVAAERVDRELLRLKAEYHGSAFDEALAEGQQSPQELRERIEARLLVEKYFVDKVFSREAVTEKEIADYYAAHPDEFAQPEQVHAAQIVVKTLDDARKVAAKLRDGLAFDEAARRFSLSPDAKVGGDLGFFRKGVMPSVFDQTCFAIPPGKMSDIVESEYGYHLFKVLEKRPAAQRSLDDVRGEVEKKLLRAKYEEAQKRTLKELREKAHISIDEKALAKVSVTPPPTPPDSDPR